MIDADPTFSISPAIYTPGGTTPLEHAREIERGELSSIALNMGPFLPITHRAMKNQRVEI